MRLLEAISKARKQKVIGWLLILTAFILLSMSLVLFINRVTKGDTSIFQIISRVLNNITFVIYQDTWFLKPLWEYSPELHYPNVFVEGNLKFLAVVGILILGVIMRDSGDYLFRRINEVKQKAEEKSWGC